MRDRFAEGRHASNRQASNAGPAVTVARHAGPTRAVPFAAVLAGILLTGCSSFTFLADPGQYQFYACEQLAPEMVNLTKRQQDLKNLMDRADQSAGGTAVGLIAYRTDYINIGEQMKLLDAAAGSKNCERPEAWRSNAALR